MLNVRMDYVLFPIKQTEETMTCQNGLWSLPYLTYRRDHDTFNVKMDWSLPYLADRRDNDRFNVRMHCDLLYFNRQKRP
jgi:hypothetical protein